MENYDQFKDLDNELCIQEEESDRLFMSKCKDTPNNNYATWNPLQNYYDPATIENGNTKFDTRPVHLNTLTNNIKTISPKKRVY